MDYNNQERKTGIMNSKNIRLVIVAAVVLGIAFLAGGNAVWAGQNAAGTSTTNLEQSELSVSFAQPQPGTVKPPPSKGSFCQNGFYSVGGVVTLNIQELAPGYCIKAELWNPVFKAKLIPEEAGKVLADALSIEVYYNGSLVYEVLPGDGIVEACYAIPPEKQAQFYFYDYYGVRFEKRTDPPDTWDPVETRTDDNNITACAFTQTSGIYDFVGK